MHNGHQKLYLYKILLIFCVDISHQSMNLTITLTILSKIPTVLLHTVLNYDIIFLIQARVSLFQYLILQHIS